MSGLKIKPSHYDFMLTKMRQAWIAQPNIDKRSWTERRIMWDMWYSTKNNIWVCDVLYQYMDDTHIESALRRIMKTLKEGT